MIRLFSSRLGVATVAVLLLAAAAAGSNLVLAKSDDGREVQAFKATPLPTDDTPGTDTLIGRESATDAPVPTTDASMQATDAPVSVDDDVDGDAMAENGPNADAKAREDLLAAWNALNQERQQLMKQLQAVHGEMQAVASELWSHEVEEARERIREQLNEYGGDYGEDIVEWLPPKLIDRISDYTGWTPDELREMLRDGAWGELF